MRILFKDYEGQIYVEEITSTDYDIENQLALFTPLESDGSWFYVVEEIIQEEYEYFVRALYDNGRIDLTRHKVCFASVDDDYEN